jgi:hypothetical protein
MRVADMFKRTKKRGVEGGGGLGGGIIGGVGTARKVEEVELGKRKGALID